MVAVVEEEDHFAHCEGWFCYQGPEWFLPIFEIIEGINENINEEINEERKKRKKGIKESLNIFFFVF